MEYRARVVKLAGENDVKALLAQIGCDPTGIGIMTPKAMFYTVFIEELSTKAANLLKQTFLAKGAEVAVTRGSADLSQKKTSVLICATLKQYRQALAQLGQQPWGLPEVAVAIEQALKNYSHTVGRCYGEREAAWSIEPGKTLIMGILNLTPDSFSDGGRYNQADAAVEHVREMIADGADIIDIGAESTRPYGGAKKISAAEECDRLMPILRKILAVATVPISVDTYKSEVAERAMACGAHIINDIWGLQQDSAMAESAARNHAPVIAMHNRISTESKQDIMSELISFFERSLAIGMKAGMAREQFILDPGLGFGKTSSQNLEILARLTELKSLGCPLLVGASRKRFIGEILNLPVEERDEGTAATVVHAIINGAAIVRVHNVRMAARAAKMADALQNWRIRDDG